MYLELNKFSDIPVEKHYLLFMILLFHKRLFGFKQTIMFYIFIQF